MRLKKHCVKIPLKSWMKIFWVSAVSSPAENDSSNWLLSTCASSSRYANTVKLRRASPSVRGGIGTPGQFLWWFLHTHLKRSLKKMPKFLHSTGNSNTNERKLRYLWCRIFCIVSRLTGFASSIPDKKQRKKEKQIKRHNQPLFQIVFLSQQLD